MTPYYTDTHVTLYRGDCLDLLADISADVVISDPPYCAGGFSERSKAGGTTSTRRAIECDALSTQGYGELIRQALSRARCDEAYIFTDWRMWSHAKCAMELAGLRCRGMIVWDKGSPALGWKWRTQHELVCWGVRHAAGTPKGRGNVISMKRERNEFHYTQKPLGLMRELITYADDGIVLDPFCGSGSTLVAAKSLGRRCIGTELSPEHCATAARRLAETLPGVG